jgi:hypothetical protein
MCALPSHVNQTHTEKELELLVFHADNTLEVKQIILTFSQLQSYRTAKYELNVEHPSAANPCARALNTARPSSSRNYTHEQLLLNRQWLCHVARAHADRHGHILTKIIKG